MVDLDIRHSSNSSASLSSGLELRIGQKEVLAYKGGQAGVSAVPGSGKTLTLSLLACELIRKLADKGTLDRQEVLIVTFSRSAVQNFRIKIQQLMKSSHGALPGTGYAVRTLHSLAHEIVRSRPSAVNLDEDFAIVDERPARKLLEEAVAHVWRREPETLASYYKSEVMVQSWRSQSRARRDMDELAAILLREAKQLCLHPQRLGELLDSRGCPDPLLKFLLSVYQRYQQVLTAEHALDYDDLMRFAVDIVESDDDLCQRLQERWPFVLEDEAQDSSMLQEKLLRRLTADTGNWIRMGDPNQAINTSFNGSTPGQLSTFLRSPATVNYDLPQSGRCHVQIMACANDLIIWSSKRAHENPALEGLMYPLIEPTGQDDPQPNPEGGDPVYLNPHTLPLAKAENEIARSIRHFLRNSEGRQQTVAVLTPTNERGGIIAKQLIAAGIPVDDSLLQVSRHTTEQISKLELALRFIVNPDLKGASLVWQEIWQKELVSRLDALAEEERDSLHGQLQQLTDFLETSWQKHAFMESWMHFVAGSDVQADPLPWELKNELEHFCGALQRWSAAVVLPIDETILMLAQEIFNSSEDLALAHRVALHLGEMKRRDHMSTLQDCQRELKELASGRNRQAGLLHDASLYQAVPGRVTVSTYHASKGLEWDRVYLMGVNDYEFPSDPHQDDFRGVPYYVRDGLNLAAEGQAMLKQLVSPDLGPYMPGAATIESNSQFVDERLRLLYVGFTRARQSLGIFCDTGRTEKSNRPQALAALALEPAAA